MNLDVLRGLLRRPLVLVLLLVLLTLSGWAGYVGWNSAGGQAESHATFVVVPPWSVEDENFPNPMLNLGERATGLASALVVAIQQRSDVGASILQTGATGYDLTNISSDVRDASRSPIISVNVTGPDEATAHAGSQAILDRSQNVLKEMQEQSGTGDPRLLATLQVISDPQETTTFALRQVRSAAALGAAVLLGGILILWAIESMIARRSRPTEQEIPSHNGQHVGPEAWSNFDHVSADYKDIGSASRYSSDTAFND
jgi:hypothetical protein